MSPVSGGRAEGHGSDPSAEAVTVAGGHRAPSGSPPFPGAIAVSHLRVYPSVAADGLPGGTPHLHTVCSEAYAVIGGSGRVLTVDRHGLRTTALTAGSFVWFTPGTVHRLVNDSGDLEILVLMQNAGLPEAGDMVITFPDDVLADPDRYAAAATLPASSLTTGGDDAPVRARRDLAVEGYAELAEGGSEALARLHHRAAALVRGHVGGWRRTWTEGPWAAAEATGVQLAAMARGDHAHLADAATFALPPPPDDRRHGCCGTLGVAVWR